MSVQRVTELPALPARPDDAHKGTFGRVLIVGGSLGMSGAAALAGLAALRGGAGIVSLAVPAKIVSVVAAIEPSYLTIPLPDDERGRLCVGAKDELAELISNSTALAVGPGWGISADLIELARWLFASVERPAVIDADGLNLLSQSPEALKTHAAARILTPHPGEFSRLTGHDTRMIQENREELACWFAQEHNVVLLLKGHGTIITDGQRLAVNTTGNSGMATGGSGDVLTGLLAALLAQGLPAFEAAQLGAHLHGLAGDLAAKELTKPGLIASDLARYLPSAWSELLQSSVD